MEFSCFMCDRFECIELFVAHERGDDDGVLGLRCFGDENQKMNVVYVVPVDVGCFD